MSLHLEPLWSWPLCGVLAVGLLVVAGGSYWKQLRQRSAWLRWMLLSLRMLAALALIFAMLRPVLEFTEKSDQQAQLFILRDTSRSMTTADAGSQTTRFAATQKSLADLQPILKKLGKNVAIRLFDFDQELRASDSELKEPAGQQTAFGQTLQDLLREAALQKTLGAVILSDFAQRAVPPFDADPRAVAPRLADASLPLHTVLYGQSTLNDAGIDLALEDLLIEPVVFEKKLVPITARLRARGAAGKTVQVRVLLEDRAGQGAGSTGPLKPVAATQTSRPMKEIKLTQEAETTLVELTLVPTQSGELKIALEVEPLEGELRTRNNRLETIITVRKGGLKVAYFDRGRPEQKFLRMVNGSDKIQLDFQEIRGGKWGRQATLDNSWFQPGQYDVFIIGDIPAAAFGGNGLRDLARRVDEGAGLLMIGGFQNFSAGGYGATPLADLLPVLLDGPLARPGFPDLSAQLQQPLKMIPTATGLKRFVMQLDAPERNRVRWNGLAPLEGAVKLKPKNQLVDVLAETAEGVPLLMASEVGRARVMAFAADTTYQWALHGQAESHQRFWRQMILWLARKEADTDQPVWVRVEPRNLVPSGTALLQFGARDERGAAINDATFQVEAILPDAKRQRVTPRTAGTEHSAEMTETLKPGDYWVRVSALHQGRSVGIDAFTRFIVDPRDLELDNPAADADLQRDLAALTGGRALSPAELPDLVQKFTETRLGELERITRINLWDNWWFLLIFVGLQTAEWTIRKRAGLV